MTHLRDVPCRVLFLGDVHGDLGFLRRAVKLAAGSGVDLIVQAGDFGFWTHTSRGRAFLTDAQDALAQAGIPLVFVDGNHENFEHLLALPVDDDGFRRVRPLLWHAPRGHAFEVGGHWLLAMGGAHSIDGPGGPDWFPFARGPVTHPDDVSRALRSGIRWVHEGLDLGNWWPQETIRWQDVEVARRAVDKVRQAGGTIDVVVSHDRPGGVPLPDGMGPYDGGEPNRRLLREVVEVAGPRLLVHGHLHRRETLDVDGLGRRRGDGGRGPLRIEALADNTSREVSHLLLDLHPHQELDVDVDVKVPSGRL